MIKIPHIPQWDALHPLIVHFPVALLLTVPIFIVLGFVWKKHRQCFFMVSFIMLLFGVIGAVVAVSTGEAAGQLVERRPDLDPVLIRHSELAKISRIVFAILTVVYAGILFLPALLKKDIKPLLKWILISAFLAIYLVCTLILVNTAELGGRLVHQFGVHALL
ncbi:MAG: DUF2231 domain-containing protein [Acidobacteria bacterium]|jgi:uncharacterized membrane protein|nr:DUF2231 domain-containing protein [Acidobacteriota bacterium]